VAHAVDQDMVFAVAGNGIVSIRAVEVQFHVEDKG
jgi:hypothetical protein